MRTSVKIMENIIYVFLFSLLQNIIGKGKIKSGKTIKIIAKTKFSFMKKYAERIPIIMEIAKNNIGLKFTTFFISTPKKTLY